METHQEDDVNKAVSNGGTEETDSTSKQEQSGTVQEDESKESVKVDHNDGGEEVGAGDPVEPDDQDDQEFYDSSEESNEITEDRGSISSEAASSSHSRESGSYSEKGIEDSNKENLGPELDLDSQDRTEEVKDNHNNSSEEHVVDHLMVATEDQDSGIQNEHTVGTEESHVQPMEEHEIITDDRDSSTIQSEKYDVDNLVALEEQNESINQINREEENLAPQENESTKPEVHEILNIIQLLEEKKDEKLNRIYDEGDELPLENIYQGDDEKIEDMTGLREQEKYELIDDEKQNQFTDFETGKDKLVIDEQKEHSNSIYDKDDKVSARDEEADEDKNEIIDSKEIDFNSNSTNEEDVSVQTDGLEDVIKVIQDILSGQNEERSNVIDTEEKDEIQPAFDKQDNAIVDKDDNEQGRNLEKDEKINSTDLYGVENTGKKDALDNSWDDFEQRRNLEEDENINSTDIYDLENPGKKDALEIGWIEPSKKEELKQKTTNEIPALDEKSLESRFVNFTVKINL